MAIPIAQVLAPVRIMLIYIVQMIYGQALLSAAPNAIPFREVYGKSDILILLQGLK
jgi:hypothetical protein